MPILVAPPNDDAGQGDLLVDVTLFVTSTSGAAKALKANRALVVSRDCAIANKPRVVVAPVEIQPLDPERLSEDPEKDFDALRRHLAMLRDGGLRPDHLYLGAYPDGGPRMTARLDQLCSLELPEDAATRRAWIETHRTARLSEDFLRALPVRLFWGFGRVGFDDISWYPTSDLRALVTAGSRWLNELRAKRDTAELLVDTGSGGDAKRDEGLAKARDAAALRLAKADSTIEPFRQELERRR